MSVRYPHGTFSDVTATIIVSLSTTGGVLETKEVGGGRLPPNRYWARMPPLTSGCSILSTTGEGIPGEKGEVIFGKAAPEAAENTADAPVGGLMRLGCHAWQSRLGGFARSDEMLPVS